MNLPASNNQEIEITTIGSGGGYGEAVVLKLDPDNWVVVDSCIDPKSGDSLVIRYLENQNIDFGTVRLIVLTHYHDDHVNGISNLFKRSPNARLVVSSCQNRNLFINLININSAKLKKQNANSATSELKECFEILESRNQHPISATHNQILFSDLEKEINIIALSPSPKTQESYDHEIGRLINDFGKPSKRLKMYSANFKSVVLYISVGINRIILGADMELDEKDDEIGWLHILNNSAVIAGRSSVFKIAHHGSENGYTNRIFDELLTDEPNCSITSWNLNDYLPQAKMISTYLSHTSKLFQTSAIVGGKDIELDKISKKILKRVNAKRKTVKFQYGLIRFRKNIEEESEWNTDLDGEAFMHHPS